MLNTPNPALQLKVSKDIAHQQVLLAEIITFKYKIMTRLLKRDWNVVGMSKKIMMYLIEHI